VVPRAYDHLWLITACCSVAKLARTWPRAARNFLTPSSTFVRHVFGLDPIAAARGQVDVGDARFSWMRSSLREPGMGTMKSSLCSIHANEIWAGVTPVLFTKSVIRSSKGWFARMLSLSNRVMPGAYRHRCRCGLQ
jgi:hypothetical protein